MQAMCATIPMHRQEPMVLTSATTILPNDTKIGPRTAPTKDMVVNTISLNNASLRSRGFPDEPLTTRRYEILHRFMDRVSDPVLQQQLTVGYAIEAFLTDTPTVESLFKNCTRTSEETSSTATLWPRMY